MNSCGNLNLSTVIKEKFEDVMKPFIIFLINCFNSIALKLNP